MIRFLPLVLALAPTQVGAFDLSLPVDCVLGETCYIQQYPDHDPSAAATDFTCGSLSYDGHDGTDFALPTRRAMEDGVAVLAAEAGRVTNLRDGIADFAPVQKGVECGNGIVIDHGEGWKTQYCHLKQGSVLVSVGDQVEAGDPLGLIGQSGMAEFPHVHLSVRKNGEKLDPFALGAPTCGAAGDDLWETDLPYQPGGLLQFGFADHVPDYQAIKDGLAPPNLTAAAPALVLWAYLFGSRKGDALLITIEGPQGAVIQERVLLEKTQALLFRAVGKKLRQPTWPEGTYTGTVRLLRGGADIDQAQITLQLGP